MDNNLTVTVVQPHFLPSVLMLHRVLHSDKVIVLGDSLFNRYHMQAQLETQNGPLKISPNFVKAGKKPMDTVELADNRKWLDKTLKTLDQVYGKYETYKRSRSFFHYWLEMSITPQRTSYSLGMSCYRHMMAAMGSTKDIQLIAYEWFDGSYTTPSDRIAGITARAGGRHYLQGKKSMDAYFNPEDFRRRGIRLYSQHLELPEGALGGETITPASSWVDAFFKLGPHRLEDLLLNANYDTGAIRPYP